MQKNKWISAFDAALQGLALDESAMAHLLCGGFGGGVEQNLATIHSAEKVNQGLHCLDARVFARPVYKLANEAQRYTCAASDGLESSRACIAQAALEVFRDGFNLHVHTKYRIRFDDAIPFAVLQVKQSVHE